MWGNSTAAALYPGLKKAEETIPFRLARFTAPGCAPILAARLSCNATNDLVFGFLKSSRPDIVLLHAMWDPAQDLDKLQETIRQLKALNVPRIVILGPVPLWKRTLPHALVNYYRFRHVIADRIRTGVTGAGSDETDGSVQPGGRGRIYLGVACACATGRVPDAGRPDGR